MAFLDAFTPYGVGNLEIIARVCNGSQPDTFRPFSVGRPASFEFMVDTEDEIKQLMGFDGVLVPAIGIPTKREVKIKVEFDVLNWSIIQVLGGAIATNEALKPEFTVESRVFTAAALTYTLQLTPASGVLAPSISTMFLSNGDGKILTFAATPVAGISFGYAAGVVSLAGADVYGSGRWDIAYIGTRTGSQTTMRIGSGVGIGIVSFRGILTGRESAGCDVDLGVYAPSCAKTTKLVLGSNGGKSSLEMTALGPEPAVVSPLRGGYRATAGLTI